MVNITKNMNSYNESCAIWPISILVPILLLTPDSGITANDWLLLRMVFCTLIYVLSGPEGSCTFANVKTCIPSAPMFIH